MTHENMYMTYINKTSLPLLISRQAPTFSHSKDVFATTLKDDERNVLSLIVN